MGKKFKAKRAKIREALLNETYTINMIDTGALDLAKSLRSISKVLDKAINKLDLPFEVQAEAQVISNRVTSLSQELFALSSRDVNRALEMVAEAARKAPKKPTHQTIRVHPLFEETPVDEVREALDDFMDRMVVETPVTEQQMTEALEKDPGLLWIGGRPTAKGLEFAAKLKEHAEMQEAGKKAAEAHAERLATQAAADPESPLSAPSQSRESAFRRPSKPVSSENKMRLAKAPKICPDCDEVIADCVCDESDPVRKHSS